MTNSMVIRPETRKLVEAAKAKIASRGARLIFALDATASREQTWDIACELQAQMFKEVAAIGGLSVQLVYFRGDECKASPWLNNPDQLARMMRGLACRAGKTQIGKVLAHVKKETESTPVSAFVLVGDACEENRDELVGIARELGVKAFMFQEGNISDATAVFRDIALVTEGAYSAFNAGAARQLGELLKAVAAFAVGGLKALEGRRDEASIKLLGQLK
jgi:hypothetical protein